MTEYFTVLKSCFDFLNSINDVYLVLFSNFVEVSLCVVLFKEIHNILVYRINVQDLFC